MSFFKSSSIHTPSQMASGSIDLRSAEVRLRPWSDEARQAFEQARTDRDDASEAENLTLRCLRWN